jgi:hypothetical protein
MQRPAPPLPHASIVSSAAAVAAAPAIGTGAATAAWLHIHAGMPGGTDPSRVRSLWRQVCSLGAADHGNAAGRLDMEIHDLAGHRVLAITDASHTVVLTLPAGTYHVLALQCRQRRQYTVALQPGSVVDLHLRLPPTTERSGPT